MSERLKFKVMQGADEVYAERHDDDWFIVATKAGYVVRRYRMDAGTAEVDVFAAIRVTLGAVRAGT